MLQSNRKYAVGPYIYFKISVLNWVSLIGHLTARVMLCTDNAKTGVTPEPLLDFFSLQDNSRLIFFLAVSVQQQMMHLFLWIKIVLSLQQKFKYQSWSTCCACVCTRWRQNNVAGEVGLEKWLVFWIIDNQIYFLILVSFFKFIIRIAERWLVGKLGDVASRFNTPI